MHSTFSDGTETPTTIAAMAHEIGLSAVALTDHDNTASHDEMAAACAQWGIDLVVGCEISLIDPVYPRRDENGKASKRGVHVLAYFLPTDPASSMQQFLAHLRRDRADRNSALLEKLQSLGFERLTMDIVRSFAGSDTGVGRPHFAQAMLTTHPELVNTDGRDAISAVFADWLGVTGQAYLKNSDLTIEQAVDAAAGTGTVLSVAHPLLNYFPDASHSTIEAELPAILRSLGDRGITGIEAHYGGSNATTRAFMVKMTRDAGLIPTGGSDFHGAFKPDVRLGVGRSGDLHVPDSVLDELRVASEAARA